MKKYLTSIIFIILSIGCFTSYAIIGSHILEDGTLVEPFALIPIGFLFFLLGNLSGFGIGLWSLFKKPKRTDKWLFGIFTSIIIIFSLYLVATISYLNEQANNEVLQEINQQ